jgi:hypothetical protein
MTPIGQITLPLTFETRENFRTKYMQFEVANFETTYNAFPREAGAHQVHHNSSLCLLCPEDVGLKRS